jgi:hypothetical protein
MEKITWTAPEYEHIPKGKGFNMTIAVIGGLILLWQIRRGDFTMSLITILAGVLIIIFGHKKPKQRTFSLTDKGIFIDENFYPYEQFSSFCIFHEMPFQEISFLRKNAIFAHFHIPLGGQNHILIQDFLKKYLKQETHRYPLSDLIAKFLGF